MNFFEHQEVARRRTSELIVYYSLAVVFIILAIYIVALLIFARTGQGQPFPGAPLRLWNPSLLFVVTLTTGSIILLGTVYKVLALSRNAGESVARALGGRLVPPNSRDFGERRLLNVVEEMALASGTPVPRVFLLENEPGINAFAAGYTPADAVIAVTSGCAHLLTRDELQGVIAHEFSHIFNGDMRLNIRLIGVLNGILVIAILGYWLFRIMLNTGGGSGRSSRDKRGGAGAALVLLGLALMAIGYIGVFFGNLIKSAVSRQREYLADASAVQFTRNPLGLVGALKKIGGLLQGSRIASPRAQEASHLFFANGMRSAWFQLLATHPPLPERIRRIDPSFDGTFAPVALRADDGKDAAPEPAKATAASRPPPVPVAVAAAFAASPHDVAAQAGAPRAEHLAYAAGLLAAIPPDIRAALRETVGAQALVYGSLLNTEPEIRAKQLAYLAGHADARVHGFMLQNLARLTAVDVATRLPLIELALPALRHLSAAEYKIFRDHLNFLTTADQQIDLFEYALLRMIARHLDPVFSAVKPPVIQYYSLKPIRAQGLTLLATLARFGNDDPRRAADAFAKGLTQLKGMAPEALLPAEQCSLETLDKALDTLTATSPSIKRQIIDACTACIAADGTVTAAEGELLRAIADALDVPMPPFVMPAAA